MSALKNYVSEEFVKQLAAELARVDGKFSRAQFLKSVLDQNWKDRELKQCLRHVATTLGENLAPGYIEQLKTLQSIAPKFSGLAALVFPDFVEIYGLENEAESLAALEEFTRYSTSEFAIRPFIARHQTAVLARMEKWSRHPDENVRRLASEGSRPRLPWSFQLKSLVKDPSPCLAILKNLKDDESLYVRKSVANHLNDISKDHPDKVLRIAKEWIGKSPRTDWILKHALRTLLKKGDQRALKLFGTAKAKNVEIQALKFSSPAFKIGGHLEFSFVLANKARRSQKLRLAYAVHYLKKGGQHSVKVFKLAERDFPPGRHSLKRRHSLRQMTTRVHYTGLHHLDIIVNGEVLARGRFHLK